MIVADDTGASLDQARFDLITSEDLKALAAAGLRDANVPTEEGADAVLARLGLAVRRGHELSFSTVRRLAEAADGFQGPKLSDQLAKAAAQHSQTLKNVGPLMNDKFAQLPQGISAQMAQHSAALEAATNALRTSAASFFTEENQRAANIFKATLEAQKDSVAKANRRLDSVPQARLIEPVSSPIVNNLREQTALIKQEHGAVLETARRTGEMSAHMGIVASEISTISNTLITKVLPAWHQSDVESRDAANRSMHIASRSMRTAVWALVATVIIGFAQIIYNRLDRGEDLERIAKEAEQSEQRERAANARLAQAERDAAATREVLQGLKGALDATAASAASAAAATTIPPVRLNAWSRCRFAEIGHAMTPVVRCQTSIAEQLVSDVKRSYERRATG